MLLRDLLLTGGPSAGGEGAVPGRLAAGGHFPGWPQLFLPPARFSCQFCTPLENRCNFPMETRDFHGKPSFFKGAKSVYVGGGGTWVGE